MTIQSIGQIERLFKPGDNLTRGGVFQLIFEISDNTIPAGPPIDLCKAIIKRKVEAGELVLERQYFNRLADEFRVVKKL